MARPILQWALGIGCIVVWGALFIDLLRKDRRK